MAILRDKSKQAILDTVKNIPNQPIFLLKSKNHNQTQNSKASEFRPATTRDVQRTFSMIEHNTRARYACLHKVLHQHLVVQCAGAPATTLTLPSPNPYHLQPTGRLVGKWRVLSCRAVTHTQVDSKVFVLVLRN